MANFVAMTFRFRSLFQLSVPFRACCVLGLAFFCFCFFLPPALLGFGTAPARHEGSYSPFWVDLTDFTVASGPKRAAWHAAFLWSVWVKKGRASTKFPPSQASPLGFSQRAHPMFLLFVPCVGGARRENFLRLLGRSSARSCWCWRTTASPGPRSPTSIGCSRAASCARSRRGLRPPVLA